MTRWLKGTFYEVVRTCDRDKILQFREIVGIKLVFFDKLGGYFGMLWTRKTTNYTSFQIRNILNKHFCLLHLIDVDEVNAEVKDVKFVIETEAHDAACGIKIPLRFKILFC